MKVKEMNVIRIADARQTGKTTKLLALAAIDRDGVVFTPTTALRDLVIRMRPDLNGRVSCAYGPEAIERLTGMRFVNAYVDEWTFIPSEALNRIAAKFHVVAYTESTGARPPDQLPEWYCRQCGQIYQWNRPRFCECCCSAAIVTLVTPAVTT